MSDKGNNPPDVSLDLTSAQATFMLENCLANMRLCFAMVMSIAEEKITLEEKRIKAEKYENLRREFAEVSLLLRKAGAKEKDDGQ